MNHPSFTVDAFTRVAFGGNSAAVCLLHEPLSPKWRQDIAAEVCFWETASIQLGQDQLKGHQLSARGGEVGAIVGTEGVSLIGESAMVMKGALQ